MKQKSQSQRKHHINAPAEVPFGYRFFTALRAASCGAVLAVACSSSARADVSVFVDNYKTNTTSLNGTSTNPSSAV